MNVLASILIAKGFCFSFLCFNSFSLSLFFVTANHTFKRQLQIMKRLLLSGII